MFKLEIDESIKMYNGDSGNFAIAFSDYKLSELDEMIFCVRTNEGANVFKKKISLFRDGVAIIDLDTKDTLNIAPGEYLYYIALKPYNQGAFNLICQREFIIERGVINEL